MRPGLRALLIPVVAAAACASGPTEVMVVVTSDLPVPTALDHLRIEATGAHSLASLVREYDLARPENQLPLSLGLLPSTGAGGELHVVVTGTLQGLTVATRSASLAFVPNETRTLAIRLSVGGDVDGGQDAGADGGQDARVDGAAPKHNGSPCGAAGECASGICVDGICCNVPCTGACQSCTMAVAPGTCMPVAAGSVDPHGVCVAQAPTTCGLDGLCAGDGTCRRYKAGVACSAESCAGNVYAPPSTCDGAGQCQPAPAMSCSAGRACGPGGCKLVPTLTMAGTASTPLVGPSTSDPIVRDLCPMGSILVGFDFNVRQDIVAVNGLRAHCGFPRVAFDGASIVIDPGDTLPWVGPGSPGTDSSVCPSNQAVVGFTSRHGLLVDQLALHCAPLSVDANKTVTIGSVTTLPPVGGTGGGPDPTTDCPSGGIAIGDITRSNSTYLEDFGMTCTKLVAR